MDQGQTPPRSSTTSPREPQPPKEAPTAGMNRVQSREAGPSRDPGQSPPDLLSIVQHMDGQLDELRGRLESITREQRHREFSSARTVGWTLEVMVVAAVVMALADWVYGVREGPQLVKLAFAGVFQLGALTAFVLARR